MGLLKASVAIDGSKFKAVNNRDKNFTKAKVGRRRTPLEQSISGAARHCRPAGGVGNDRTEEHAVERDADKTEIGDGQARSHREIGVGGTRRPTPTPFATSGRGSGVVGYNVKTAVDTENHLIVAHEVSNVGSGRSQLANTAKAANPLRSMAPCALVRRLARLDGQMPSSNERI